MKRTLLLICTLLCANVLFAQVGTKFWVGDIQYQITLTNPAEVKVYDAITSITTANIPETINYNETTYSVTSIGNNAFLGCTSLTYVTIPENITSVGDYAFNNCSSLTTLNFNAINCNFSSYYNRRPFINCPITTINIGDSVQVIPDHFAHALNDLTSINIPNSVTSIGNQAFYGCSSLTSVTIPESVTSIANSAFDNCSTLTTLNFNAINCNDFQAGIYYPFENCPITTINIGDGVQRIPASFADYLETLTSVTIPNSVTSIGDDAFSYCRSLTSVTIPENVTSIGDYAFEYCTSLTLITIPENVTSIGKSAFSGCSNLRILNFNAINCVDFYYYRFSYASYSHPFSNCPINTINIGEGVQRIPDHFAHDLGSLTNVICFAVTPTITELGDSSFIGTPSNKTLIVPCGSKNNYISSSLGNVFSSNNIFEMESSDVVAFTNNPAYGSVAVESDCFTATLTANPTICSQFISWNDGNTDNPRTINLTNDTSFIATFAKITYTTELSATICEGEVYNDNNFNVSEAGVYTQNLPTVNGCDSIVTLTLNVNPIYNTELTATICEGQAYTENNFNVSEAGVYTQNLQTINGCDSIVTLTLNVNPIYNTELTATICQGQTYTENGFNVSEAGTYTQNLTTANGCDSIVTLTLTVLPSYNINLTATICQGSELNISGFNVSEAGVYTQNLQTINGCDSIVTLTLNVNPIFNTELTASICEGQTYTENGFNVSEAGVYTQNLQTINGCDSIVTLTLNVNPIYNTELTATICEGQTYTENGFNVNEAGVYTQNLQTINGCDSIVTLTLNVNPIYNTELTATICQGQTYTENNFNVSEAGVYTQTLQNINGCDSIVTLTLNVNPIYNTELTASICQGQVYTENGFNVSEAGVYTQTLQTINGCDSIVTLTLNVNPIYNTELTATICEGQTYTENNFNVSEAGVYTQNLQSVNGCDSIVTLTLNVNPIYNTELTATICEGQTYTENNFNVSEAGVYTQNLQTINGCDSIVTLTLNVNPIYNTELTATICQGQTYTENGFNVNEAGVYTQNLQTINGCDSIVTLTLNVNPIYNTELTATICQGQTYTENGFNVNEAGVYTQTLQTVNGCDSIVTLTLNVNPIYNTELSATICEGSVYTENNFNVSEAGVYTQTLQTINGCDSIVTLTLNVNPIYNTELTATICEGQAYTENGFNVSEAGVYTQNLQTINGCDSIVTLTLNVNPIVHTELSATICEGSVYNDNGFNVNEAGVYTQTLTSVNGCDSIVTLTLTVNPIFHTELSATICEGQAYTENNFNVSEAGVYTQNLQTINGCDSIVTLTLNVNPIYNTELTATICEGQAYTENGFNVNEAGVYTQNLQTINGCDSIVTLTLNVNPIFNTELTATICEGSVYNDNGFNVSEAGTYTQNLQSVNGCDSIVTLTLTVLPSYNTNLTATICEGSELNISGFHVSEAGVYTQTYTAVNGCDSIVTLTVTELPIIHTDLTLTICEGTSLNFSGFNVSEAGVYTQTLTSANGCDSIVTLTVSVNPVFDTTINATINSGETYTEFGFNESEAGTYVQNLQTVNGCDSTITLNLTVNSSLYDVAELTEITFYPNPTSGMLTFSKEIEKIEVIDNIGKIVMRFFDTNEINLESLPSGAYYLRMTIEDKTIMRKVIKE